MKRVTAAIDIASVIMDDAANTRLTGNSAVTIAFNVFEDVWRRSPRIAQTGNFGHVFNNLLYHWGFGNNDDAISYFHPGRAKPVEVLFGPTD